MFGASAFRCRVDGTADLPSTNSINRVILMASPVRVHEAFVDTMGADGMGADGLPIQIPLLCWEPAPN